MAVPLLDLDEQNKPLLAQMCRAFEQIVTSGQFILGQRVELFEQHLSACCGARHAVAVSSGTDALLMALMALGVGPGDEVITTPFTFFATAGGIARVGAKPVFVDIDPASFNIDPARIEPAVTSKTKAIIPVHLFGLPCDMEPILAIARRHRLKIIEDAAQAIGARDGDRTVGSIGDVGCLSFYPTKNLSALGDAGACTANDAGLAGLLVSLRAHGQRARYEHTIIGGNFRIDVIQAVMLDLKLPRLETWTQQRRQIAAGYNQQLAGLPVVLPVEKPGKHHVYHQYTVRVPGGRRDALREHLRAKGIGHEVYYPSPMHLQACFSGLGGRPGDFPVAEQACQEVLSLPVFPGLTDAQQQEVVSAIRGFFR